MDYPQELAALKKIFHSSDDIIFRPIVSGKVRVCAVYADGMVNMLDAELGVLAPLIESSGNFIPDLQGVQNLLRTVQKIEEYASRKQFADVVCRGALGLIIEGAKKYYTVALHGYPTRAISEPPTSAVVKGPREGFTEDFKANMVMLRRRFGSGKLVFMPLEVGRYTKTQIRICYVDGITDKRIVGDVAQKLKTIDIDGIVDSSYVSSFLEKRNYSVFKQIGSSEKPDIIASKLLDGRVAIIVDGSPMVLTLPFVLIEDFHDSEDYYRRPVRTALIRVMRLLGVFFAVLLPSVFVALTSIQYQILPLELMITVMNSTSGIPFSPVLEMLIALIFFEVLGEASVRMPRYFGMAISVVGGIILGETAVSAGILSSLTVLITAMSSIGLFAIPDEVGSFSVIRIALVFVGATLGIYGIVLAVAGLTAYVASIEQYGVAYLQPFAPLIKRESGDSILKRSIKDDKFRTPVINKNKRKLSDEK